MNKRMCALRTRSEGEWHSTNHFQNLEISNDPDVSFAITTIQKVQMIVEYEE